MLCDTPRASDRAFGLTGFNIEMREFRVVANRSISQYELGAIAVSGPGK